MRRLWPVVRDRVGRRGVVLLCLAYFGFLYGLSLLHPVPNASMTFLASLAPLPVFAATWLLCGVLCLVQAFLRSDRAGFAYAAGVNLAWALLFIAGWLLGAQPRGWLTASFFLPFAGLALAGAGWPEKLRLPVTSVGDDYPDAVITANEQGIVTSWGGSASLMFGWDEREIVGHPVDVLMPGRYRVGHRMGLDRVRIKRRSHLAGQTLEAYGITKDGVEFPIQVLIGAVDMPDGLRLSAVIRDLRSTR